MNAYNHRLFEAGGLRSYYHLSRYRWLARKLQGPLKIIELGCFDGKTLDFLPGVSRYVGLDANWENGLDEARARYGARTNVEFRYAQTADALACFADGEFDAAIALETLEHIPRPAMKDYLRELARVTNRRLYVSVPNEMGPVFLAKYLFKKLRYGDGERYTLREVVAATLFRPDLVERDNHKGFDFREMVRDIAEHFTIETVEGIPFLPPSLALTVGIVAESIKLKLER